MRQENIRLPQDVIWLLQTLHAAGYSAYVVGGCVRDSSAGPPARRLGYLHFGPPGRRCAICLPTSN